MNVYYILKFLLLSLNLLFVQALFVRAEPTFDIISLSTDGSCSLNNIETKFRTSKCEESEIVRFGKQAIIHSLDDILTLDVRIKNKKLFFGSIYGINWKLDIKSDAAKSLLLTEISKYIKKTGSKRIFLSPMDGEPLSYKILADFSAEDYLRFYVEVISELNKEFDGVNYYAYFYAGYNFFNAQIGEIEIPENLWFIVARYNSYDQTHSLDDNSPSITPYRNFTYDVRRFLELNPKKVIIFEYYWKLNWLGAIWPIWRRNYEDVTWMQDNEIAGVISQVPKSKYISELDLFSYYVVEQRNLNPDASYDAILKRYSYENFGEQAHFFMEFIGKFGHLGLSRKGLSGRHKQEFCDIYRVEVLEFWLEKTRGVLVSVEDLEIIEKFKRMESQLLYTKDIVDICKARYLARKKMILALKKRVNEGYYLPLEISPEITETYYDDWVRQISITQQVKKFIIKSIIRRQ